MSSFIFILYPLSCIIIPCIVYMLVQIYGFRRKTTGIHLLWVFIFLFYIYLVLETTGIGTIWEIGLYPGTSLSKEINLIPFRDGITFSMILNIIMFMPLGFLPACSPEIWTTKQESR